MQGGDTAAVLKPGLPNVTSGTDWVLATRGNLKNPTDQGPAVGNGCLTVGVDGKPGRQSNNYTMPYSRIDASRCSTVYGNSSTVQPPAIQLIPQIKY